MVDKTSDLSLSDHDELYTDNSGDLSIISRGDVVSVRRLVSDLARLEEVNPKLSKSSELVYSLSSLISQNNDGLNSSEMKSDSDIDYERLKEINKMLENKNIYLYNSSKYSFDVLTDSITLDLIDNSKYTNTVDLSNIIKKSEQDKASAIVNFTIFYSISGAINSKNLTFNIGSSDFVNNVHNDVSVEYINGILRAVPINQNVDECIINSCEITYGGI